MASSAAFGEIGGEVAATAPPADVLPADTRRRIFGYLGVLLILTGIGTPVGGLIGLPISFFLKNQLHLNAAESAIFGLIAHAPLYVSFLFGFARDRWNLLRRGDRGLMIVFGTASAVLYAGFAFAPPTYGVLLGAVLLLVTAFLFIASAARGITSTLGQQHVMSGQLSAAWHVFEMVPAAVAMLIGGALSQALEGAGAVGAARTLFLVGAAVMAGVAMLGLWRPAAVFDNLRPERLTGDNALADARRLVRYWPVWPALLIWLMWSFDPGSRTPLQYYMQNTLHATDSQWGQFHAIAFACFLPPLLLYGWLCRRFRLGTLLFWGTVIGIPQYIPLLFIHSVNGALMGAAFIGLTGGLATASYYDLMIRSCPRALQGTMLMAAVALQSIDSRFGDVLGAWLYQSAGGFASCAWAITGVYALILPVLLLVPRRLTATTDGQAPAARGEGRGPCTPPCRSRA
jgi:hypothetical protein